MDFRPFLNRFAQKKTTSRKGSGSHQNGGSAITQKGPWTKNTKTRRTGIDFQKRGGWHPCEIKAQKNSLEGTKTFVEEPRFDHPFPNQLNLIAYAHFEFFDLKPILHTSSQERNGSWRGCFLTFIRLLSELKNWEHEGFISST